MKVFFVSGSRSRKLTCKYACECFCFCCKMIIGIWFKNRGRSTPESIDMAKMSEDQFHVKIQRGYESYKAGRTQNAAEALNKFRESHSCWTDMWLISLITLLPIWRRCMNILSKNCSFPKMHRKYRTVNQLPGRLLIGEEEYDLSSDTAIF